MYNDNKIGDIESADEACINFYLRCYSDTRLCNNFRRWNRNNFSVCVFWWITNVDKTAIIVYTDSIR